MSAFLELSGRWFDVALTPVCGRVRFPREWSSGAEWWRTLVDHDLWFVWAGRGVMEIDGQPLPLRAGSCVWMQPGRRYVTTHDGEHPLGVNYFHFTLHASGKRPGSGNVPAFAPTTVRHFDFVDLMMQRILAVRGEPDGGASANHLFAALLHELHRDTHHTRPVAPRISHDHAERIHAAAARIRQDLAAAPPVAVLAREHGYSVSHFSRTFAAIMGERPQAFLINARIERARDLLATTSLSIGEIAAAVGIPDLFYFSRLFKRRLGTTASEFRRRALDSGG